VKSRHAAALALVGWYLMVPPVADRAYDLSQPRLIEGSAPLSDWLIRRAYDTADECEKAKEELRKDGWPRIVSSRKDSNTTERIWSIDKVQESTAECIETDDPRLKEK